MVHVVNSGLVARVERVGERRRSTAESSPLRLGEDGPRGKVAIGSPAGCGIRGSTPKIASTMYRVAPTEWNRVERIGFRQGLTCAHREPPPHLT